MKAFFLFSIISLCIMCKEATQGIKEKNKIINQDSLKLIDLLSNSTVNYDALIIKNDTIFFLTPSKINVPKFERVKKIYYNFSEEKFHFYSKTDINSYSDSFRIKSIMDEPHIYIKSLIGADIKYAKPTDDMKKNIRVQKVLNHTSKINKSGNKYYIINAESPKAMFVYDALSREFKEFSFNSVIVKVNDFFLYDIDKDNNPEIFIFHSGLIPRDYVMSYSIYSLRNDSVSVEIK